MAYEMINPNTKVVPIDHGWANMKTEQDVFTLLVDNRKISY